MSTLKDTVESLGDEILKEGANWVLSMTDTGEGHSGGRLLNLMVQAEDGSVTHYGDVSEDATPENIESDDQGYGASAQYPSLKAFYDEVLDNIVEEILDDELFDRASIIKTMMSQGWEPIRNTGRVRHGNDHSREFDSWARAIEACIEIGSQT